MKNQVAFTFLEVEEGPSVAGGHGGGSDIKISSYTTTTTKVWVRINGNESQWSIPCSFPIRSGHILARYVIENDFDEKKELLLVWNKRLVTTGHLQLGVTGYRLNSQYICRQHMEYDTQHILLCICFLPDYC